MSVEVDGGLKEFVFAEVLRGMQRAQDPRLLERGKQ